MTLASAVLEELLATHVDVTASILDHKFTYSFNNIYFDDVADYALGALILRLGWRRSGSDLTILCGDDDPASFDSSVGAMPREAKSISGKSAMSEEARLAWPGPVDTSVLSALFVVVISAVLASA